MSLTKSEIMKVVNQYIGVSGGYLGDFSYRTHEEFYPEYCNLDDIDPNRYQGTTRERFITILESSESKVQAKILRGALERFSVVEQSKPETRTQELKNQILHIITRLESSAPIQNPDLTITSEIVERALTDCENLIRTNGAISGVDRIHTALHGYLVAVCNKAGIQYTAEASLTALFKLIRQQHPQLQNLGYRAAEIEKILNSSSAILDALNPVRNKATVAHPNSQLLDKDEAMLVINISRSLLHYLDSKFSKP
jgi:hypothetical protein